MGHVYSESFECKVSAQRMWHGLFKDSHNCLPKAMPSKVVGVEYPLGQHGFDFPGAERIIKYHKKISEEAYKAEKSVHEEEGVVKGEAEKVGDEVHKKALLAKEKAGDEVHKEALLSKEKAEEFAGGIKKEEGDVKVKAEEFVGGVKKEEGDVKVKAEEFATGVKKEEGEVKEKAEEVMGGVKKEEGEVKEKVEKVGGAAKKEGYAISEGVGGGVQKGVNYIKGVTTKVLEKEKEDVHKTTKIGEKVVQKEKEELGGTLHKVEEFLKKEELWVKEKIEEVEYNACKIGIRVVAGGLVGILFKHCKHTFELKDTSHEGAHGCILHWTSEFETLSSSIHLFHSFDALKQHVFEPFQHVEAYLLKHDDYKV